MCVCILEYGYRPEVNIQPWESTLKAIKQGAAQIKWNDRDPHAFWKGNPWVSPKRRDLMTCKPNKDMDWNARLYVVVRISCTPSKLGLYLIIIIIIREGSK